MTYIEQDGRGYMHASQAVCLHCVSPDEFNPLPRFGSYLYHQFHVICHPISTIQPSILIRFIRNLQQPINLLLINAYAARKLGQPLVCLVPRLIHDADIEVVGLLVEQRLAELPELLWLGLQDCGAGLVHEGGGRMPGLNLLAENELDFIGIFRLDEWIDIFVDLGFRQ